MKHLKSIATRPVSLCIITLAAASLYFALHSGKPAICSAAEPLAEYREKIQPLLKKYCLDCHSTEVKKGSLDLERFATVNDIRADLKPWQGLIEMMETGEMPPKKRLQPTAAERKALIEWTKNFLDAEARSRAGDPGYVPLRRLSNAEYNATLRDLTGIDLQPAREFPADGAAGEGFTNAAEALTEISPALLSKYLAAAKSISDRVVLLPDGFRFSRSTTRRDWTDEAVARLRQFYAPYPSDGTLPLQPYLSATIRHRDALLGGKISLAALAEKERLNAKYLSILWGALTSKTAAFPLDRIRDRWRTATEADLPALLTLIKSWQAEVWKTVRIGSYASHYTSRQQPVDPSSPETKLTVSSLPVPGQNEVVIRLVSHQLSSSAVSRVIWQHPRLEQRDANRKSPTLLLKEYEEFARAYEASYSDLFAGAQKYLAAVAESVNEPGASLETLAKHHGLDQALLKRWLDLLPLKPVNGKAPDVPGKAVPAVNLQLLEEKTQRNPERTMINGWHKKGTDLPVVVSNSSDKTELIPGRVSAHSVAVHPLPQEFVAVSWKCPMDGPAMVAAKVAHAHPACGNGVAWWLEHRRGEKATVMAEGLLDLGKSVSVNPINVKLAKGDQVLLIVDARDGNHICDMTEVALTITEKEKPARVWDLAADVANSILEGNPHADSLGNRDAWSFVRGPARTPGNAAPSGWQIPLGSLLDRWLNAANDPGKREETIRLATELEKLLTGSRPTNAQSPDRLLFDRLVSFEGPLLKSLDLSRLNIARRAPAKLGLPKDRFGSKDQKVDAASIAANGESVTEIRLPASLFIERTFVVDCRVDGVRAEALLRVEVQTGESKTADDGSGGRLLAAREGQAHQQVLRGLADFRRVFPLFICYPHIIPVDEVVCLKLFHREDEPLKELFLSEQASRELDDLWNEQRFISQWPLTENKNLPLFIGFVTQDQPKELLAFYEGFREPFRLRSEAFEKDIERAARVQLLHLMQFAARAFRHPLTDVESTQLSDLYSALRKRGSSHEDAFRGVLARVLVSPAFLFRIEQPPAGKEPGAVNDWELATRLSYFLWSSLPDDGLERVAAAGGLHDPRMLAEQTRRMLKDDRVRALAVEFGTQWLHVRGFHEVNDKNEKLFPSYDLPLRNAISEEAVLFFEDMFRNDRSVAQILDADYTFLNERLARHYGIPGVTGDNWRKVEGVKKYGRGGILGLASVQASQSGASRTSPVLRGNWVVETLLGEKLPRPPANVPRLPEEEGATHGLTVRQLVEKHAKQAECAVCHQRIDPFGFALEKYDPIGRLREKDLGGLAVDCTARLKDGTEFEGIDGLRQYLLTKKKDVFVRLFCRRLLGYALGRATTLSDQPLIDHLVATLNEHDGKVSAVVLEIVKSPQFTKVRGRDFK